MTNNKKIFLIILLLVLILVSLIYYLKKNTFLEPFNTNNKLKYKIYYINLEHRTDRKKHILNELKKINININSIQRISAIKKTIGSYGCMLSHIKTLEKALNDDVEYAIILEDDFVFKKPINIENLIDNLKNIKWDVCLLSGNHFKLNTKIKKNIYYVSGSQTASGYIIKKLYIPKLLNFWKQNDLGEKKSIDYSSMSKVDCSNEKNCPYIEPIDESWKKLQKKDKWIIINPTIGKQLESYSDILQQHTNYGV